MLKTPFSLPDGWLLTFGYPGNRRFVALYWEPSGDEACYDDGVSSACGMCDNWSYLDFIRQPHVRQWLDDLDINLGNSDESALHWLVADAEGGDIYAATRLEARAAVRAQRLPPIS